MKVVYENDFLEDFANANINGEGINEEESEQNNGGETINQNGETIENAQTSSGVNEFTGPVPGTAGNS